MTKQGSRHAVSDEILVRNEFKHGRTKDNKVTYEGDDFKIRNKITYEGDEFKIRNRVTKKDKEVEKEDEYELEL